MLVETYGSEYTICDPVDESAMEYSPTHIPNVGVLYHSNDGKHLLGDTKVVNPFTSRFKTQERIARAAAVAFWTRTGTRRTVCRPKRPRRA